MITLNPKRVLAACQAAKKAYHVQICDFVFARVRLEKAMRIAIERGAAVAVGDDRGIPSIAIVSGQKWLPGHMRITLRSQSAETGGARYPAACYNVHGTMPTRFVGDVIPDLTALVGANQ